MNVNLKEGINGEYNDKRSTFDEERLHLIA